MRYDQPTENRPCQLCGAIATAVWYPTPNGSEPLNVCGDCTTALASLAADASHGDPHLVLARMVAAFWEAQWNLGRQEVERLHEQTAERVVSQFVKHGQCHACPN